MTRFLALAGLIGALVILGQQSGPGPMDNHHSGVEGRGDQAMGFSHETTTHHFLLRLDGGIVQVEANDAKDSQGRAQIREHLTHITGMFAAGNFEAPMFIHDQIPPGVPVMKRLKNEMTYKFESTERGGQVRIRTNNPEAVKAVHDFLRFQITDHKTGDSLEIKKDKR
jgi:hypothetical protein